VVQYTSNEVKQSITGFGGADKDQVQRMVARMLSLSVVPKPADAADALALALHHIGQAPFGRIASSIGGGGEGIAGLRIASSVGASESSSLFGNARISSSVGGPRKSVAGKSVAGKSVAGKSVAGKSVAARPSLVANSVVKRVER
jgi:hypothetical protein